MMQVRTGTKRAGLIGAVIGGMVLLTAAQDRNAALDDDLRAIMTRLGGNDFLAREQATSDLRRALLDQPLALLRVSNEAPPEVAMRVRLVLDDLAAFARLLPVLVRVPPDEAELVARFFETHRPWVLDALSNDASRVRIALAQPPADEDRATSLVFAALIADGSREVPQMIAIRHIPGRLVPSVAPFLLAALGPLHDPLYFAEDTPVMQRLRRPRARWEMRVMAALDAARRGELPETVGWTLAVFRNLSERDDLSTEADLLHAASGLFTPAHARALVTAGIARRGEQPGIVTLNGVLMETGDQALILAARLMRMDDAALGILPIPGRQNQPLMLGFRNRETATAAREAITAQAMRLEEITLPGLDDARLQLEAAGDAP